MTSEFDNTLLEALTNREIDVLKMLADGASNQEIGSALFLEVSTVKWHNRQIYDKLGVKNRRQAVIRAQTLGIIKANDSNLLQPIQHNLPADTHAFIGRVQEIQELARQLTDENVRLLTIFGTGGMGKTRLAIEVGRKLLVHFKDGVYFVQFAPVSSAEQIVTTIAETIGFKFHSDKAPKQQLLEYFQKKHLLLITDNFEHLVDNAEFLSKILQYAPQIRVLVTSREKLNFAGERVYSLSGLYTPKDETSEALTDYDAVRLFVESAQRVGIEVQEADMIPIARVCRLVAGMPLAIVLAAAWVDTLSVMEIEAEIKAGLSILETNLRDAPIRHQSIHAAFDVSWKRLSHHEQTVFMRLSVFRGGFTRAAAQKFTGASVRDLQRLVHTSFIQLLPSGRYAVHELMRQYGEEKLKISGELNAVREKHAHFFAEFITPLGETSWGMAGRETLVEINADFENVRAAWLFQAEQKHITELRRFLDGIWHFLDQYSRSQEGIELFEPLLSVLADDNNDVALFRGQLTARLGWFCSDTGQHERAAKTVHQALLVVQAFHSTDDILMIYAVLARLLWWKNQPEEALAYEEKGIELSQRFPTSKWACDFQHFLCSSYIEQNKLDEAKSLLEALPESKYRAMGVASVLRRMGEHAKAEELRFSALQTYHFHRIDLLINYSTLVIWATRDGNYEKAWFYVQRGLQYADDGAYAWGTFYVIEAILRLLVAEREHHRATELLALLMLHPNNTEYIRTYAAENEDILKAKLSSGEFIAAWQRGKQLGLGDVITEYMER